jgi:hypothetical protein
VLELWAPWRHSPYQDQERIGIEVIGLKNRCLLSKWLFKLLIEEGVCQDLLHNKYIRVMTLAQVQVKHTGSPFWKRSHASEGRVP